MPLEIERKFLPRDDRWRAHIQRSDAMSQGYLMPAHASAGERASVRVRITGADAWLNIKSRDMGPVRQEFEYPIPPEDAQSLLSLCVGARVEKRRHHVDHAGHAWEIDEFQCDNAGLLVAEIELEAVGQPFERPPWLGREVTDLPRYYNLALASRPYSQWSEAERAATDAREE